MRDSRFDVWAPNAETLTLLLDGTQLPMRRTEGDWWVPDAPLEADEATHDYGYLVDGDTNPVPDPRSRWQPDGVHGLSRTFDPTRHPWLDGDWTGRPLAGSVIIEVHIGTFTPQGTLDSAIDRLDHLQQLGVDFVEVMPVNAFSGTHGWGYDGVDWFAVHEGYGGPAAYQRFVDACHERGIGVIQDVVYNHLGPSGNYLGKFGPYLSDHHATAWGDTVNLDGEHSDEVRAYLRDNVAMWLRDYHVDGLRLDAVHALVDDRAVHILEEFARDVDELEAHLGRPLTLIAESDLNNPRLITSDEAGGYGLDAQWSDDFHHAVHVNLTGETSGYYADFEGLDALAKVLTKGFFHDGTLSTFRGRHHGRPLPAQTRTWRLVVSSQNHDQIGNRAVGDRITATLSPGQLAIAATLELTSPFTPMLFMGEEWGATTPFQFFSSHPEPELAKATAEGRIGEFARMGWDPSVVPNPQEEETFTRSKLDWTELERPEHARLLEIYRELIALRRREADITTPWLDASTVAVSQEHGTLVISRGSVVIAVNFSDVERELRIERAVEVLFSTDADAALGETTGTVTGAPVRASAVPLRLPAQSAAVLRVS
ncbi:malto-oligosyltrehalose trehalohydrolase [Pseudoclavibacter helvolus]|uniref:malto-oligosyltrehalose trehalohydrolase n=1 Tax=Pseudoclavibacter helvolus TaxID=255205 RepID=UPI003C7078DB